MARTPAKNLGQPAQPIFIKAPGAPKSSAKSSELRAPKFEPRANDETLPLAFLAKVAASIFGVGHELFQTDGCSGPSNLCFGLVWGFEPLGEVNGKPPLKHQTANPNCQLDALGRGLAPLVPVKKLPVPNRQQATDSAPKGRIDGCKRLVCPDFKTGRCGLDFWELGRKVCQMAQEA